ncbi:GerMN domain-containing protein [Anaerosporobacter sp.]
MGKKKLLRIVALISILVLVGCKSNDKTNRKSDDVEDNSGVTVEDTKDVTAEETTEQEVILCYWDAMDMKLYRNTVKMENPTPEKALQLLTEKSEATGMASRLPDKMIIDEVVIDEDKIATVNVTVDEEDMGNYSSSCWAEAMVNTIVHTLIENEIFGIDKVAYDDTLNEITTFVDDIYFELKDGEIVTLDMK